MKNVVSKVLLTLGMVAGIVGLVCIVVFMMNLGATWVMTAGQICVVIGMVIVLVESYRKKVKLN